MLKIAIISKSDATGGGAGRSAETLTRLINQNGHLAHHWLGYVGKDWQPNMRKLHGDKVGQAVYKSFRLFSRAIGLPDFISPEIFFHRFGNELDYDIYHFQDISSSFSPIAIRSLARKKNVVWTFRDCSPFTAGCIYPLECEAFKTECRNCPQLGQWPLLTSIDFTNLMQRYKRKTAIEDLFQAVTPSEWLAIEAMKSGFFTKKPIVIHNSVNNIIFCPSEKNKTRYKLNLPLNEFIVLLSSMDLESKYKGTLYALSALNEIKIPHYILAIGKKNKQIQNQFPSLKIIYTGSIKDDQLLSQYYSSADVFLFPTIADNLPNVILETMSCGTPCIAFATGGVPEMIEHDKTGWLVQTKDIQGLIEGLNIVLTDQSRLKKWGHMARKTAVTKFNESILINKYLDLYDVVLSK